MLPLEALTLVLIWATGFLWQLQVASPQLHTPTIGVTNTDGPSMLPGIFDPTIYDVKVNATGFPLQEAIVADLNNFNVTAAPLEQNIQSNPVEDATASNNGYISAKVHDISSHVNTIVSHLVMGLAIIPLAIIYFATFKPLGFYGNFSEPHENPLAESFSEHKYAVYFLLAVAAIGLLEPFVTYCFMTIRDNLRRSHQHDIMSNDEQPAAPDTNALLGGLSKKLDRLVGKVFGHGVLIRDLVQTKASHALSLATLTTSMAAHSTSLSHLKVWVSRLGGTIGRVGQKVTGLEAMVSRFFQVLVEHDGDIKQLEHHVGHMTIDIANNSTTMTRVRNDIGSDIDNIINTCNQGAQVLGDRLNLQSFKVEQLEHENLMQFQDINGLKDENTIQATEIRDLQYGTAIRAGEIDILKDQLATQATDIDSLKKALAEEVKDKAAVISFCKKYVFTHQNANEYFQRTISGISDDKLAPYFAAVMTGINMQIAVMNENMVRRQFGDPTLPKYKQQQARVAGNFGAQQSRVAAPQPGNFAAPQQQPRAFSPAQQQQQQGGFGMQQSRFASSGSPASGAFQQSQSPSLHFRK